MARRTEARPDVGPPGQVPPVPPSEPHRPFWLGWIALVVVVLVALGGVGYLVLSGRGGHPQPANSPASKPTPGASDSVGPGVPATTYADFAALAPAQQQATMQQALAHYSAVLYEAYKTLNPALLPQIATGAELQVLQQDLGAAIQANRPGTGTSSFQILHILISPQPYSFVSVDFQGTDVDQYLDPKTLLPIGTPSTTTARRSFSLVIDGGVWKVRDNIEESPAS